MIEMLKKYPFIHQKDETDCGVVCLAMIIKYYGRSISVSKLREEAGTDKLGTNILGLIKAAKDNGLDATAVKSQDYVLDDKVQLPAIAHLRKRGTDKTILHYVVVYEVTDKDIVCADPADGLVKISKEKFAELWTGKLIFLEKNQEFDDKPNGISIYQRLYRIVSGEKRTLLAMFILSILYTALGVSGSFYYRLVIDTIIPKNETELLLRLTIIFVGIALFQNIMGYFRTETLLQLSKRFDTEILMGYYKHVLNLPLNFFTSRKTGEIVSRFTDASKVREALATTIVAIMLDTVLALAAGIMLFFQNQQLFIICIIIAGLYGVIVYAFNAKLEQINSKQMSESAALSAYMVESLSGIETIKAFNVESKFIRKSYDKFGDMMKTILKSGKIINLQSCLSSNLAGIGKIVVLCSGSYFVITGDMSIGTLMMFYMLMDYFINPIKTLLNLQPTIQSGKVAAERVYEVMDLEKEKIDQEDHKISGDIKIENLDFRYASRKKILSNISMHFEQGKKIAIVGESGSGKSTLGKLLLGLYEVENGHIFIGDADICDIPKSALRQQIAYVPQNISLFAGTLLENITLGIENVDYEKVQEICRMVKVEDFVKELPMGYETQVEEGGTNFSGGQKQRIAIARALIKNPQIIILDEATSNLDAITERAFSDAIRQYGTDTTIVVIAHRLSTIMNCDTIYVMENGSVIENGTHEDLLEKHGCYYNYWKSQTTKYEISA